MKTIEPTNPSTEVPAAPDRSYISDLYLTNQQFVEENEQVRKLHSEERLANDPLAVKISFNTNAALGISGAAALLVTGPFAFPGLVSLGGGTSAGVLSGVSFVFLSAMLVFLGFRGLNGALRDFCRVADISQGLVLSFIIPAIVVVAIISLAQMGQILGLLVLALLMMLYCMAVLIGIYRTVHSVNKNK